MTSDPPISSHEYEALRKSLDDSGALLALPELHGGVSGALCAGGPPAAARWADEFCADHEATNLPAVQSTALELVRATWETFTGDELAFEPLLPDEDVPLEDQVHALALWCHGFLNGLGATAPDLTPNPAARGDKRATTQSGAGADAQVPGEIAEILGDFAEISRAGVDEEDASDRDNADFALAELKEYARVSAQIVFENLAERRAAAARDVH